MIAKLRKAAVEAVIVAGAVFIPVASGVIVEVSDQAAMAIAAGAAVARLGFAAIKAGVEAALEKIGR